MPENRFSEIAGFAGILGAVEVLISVYGITPYTHFAAWMSVGFVTIAGLAVWCAIMRPSRS